MKPLIELTMGVIIGIGRAVFRRNRRRRKQHLGFRLAVRQRHRRLQRGVKAVFARILGQLAPVRHLFDDIGREGQRVAGPCVIAEHFRPEPIERGALRRG